MDIEAYISSGILEAYILGQTNVEETAIVECVAKNNVRVQEALAEISIALESLTDMQAVPLPPDLKQKIQQKIHFPEKGPKKPSAIPLPQPVIPETAAPKPGIWKGWALAASLLLVVSTAGYFYTRQQQTQTVAALAQKEQVLAEKEASINQYKEKEALLRQPGMQLVVLDGVEKHPEAKAMVMWNSHNKEVFLDVINMPQAPSGKQYQLWAMVGGKPVSAGLYEGEPLKAISSVEVAQAFAITLENEGGVASPTMENLMVLGTIKG